MRQNVKKPRFRAGFTLIEMLIVIAIMLAIVSLVVLNLMPQKDKADIDLQRIQIQDIDKAMKLFRLNLNRWPTQEEGLAVLTSKEGIQDEAEKAKWQGPYLESPVTKDKWGSDIVFKNPSDRGEGLYDIISWGPNRQDDDGKGDDITNFDNLKNAEGDVDSTGETFAPPPAGGSSGNK